MKPTRLDAYQLLHEGTLALADVERAGIAIDVAYLDNAIKQADADCERLKAKLEKDEVWRVWQRAFGAKANLGSKPQLGEVFFKHLGYKGITTEDAKKKHKRGETKGKAVRFKADEAAFAKIDHPFVKRYFRREKIRNAKTTFLVGLRNEVVDGFVHPFWHLNTVISFRSSSSDPNLQNQPTRNELMAEMVRRCYIARPGHQLLEIDYNSQEVRTLVCHSHDPVLSRYIHEDYDMHREQAAELLFLDPKDVSSDARYVAKNQFVFPEFYGSYYVDCAKGLWDHLGYKGVQAHGKPIFAWLAEHGITKLGKCDPDTPPAAGTFEHKVKKTEEKFNSLFKHHVQWRYDWWDLYRGKGYLDTLTGFRLSEVYRRNQVVNNCNQGVAFHCLLWSLIRINKWLKRYKMRSRIVNQVHDSLVIDAHPDELEDVIETVRHISTIAIRKYWAWIEVPLKVEVELCDVGASWFDKRKVG